VRLFFPPFPFCGYHANESPLGPVTNNQLGMCDYNSIEQRDVGLHRGPFGFAFNIHHSRSSPVRFVSPQLTNLSRPNAAGQKWNYLSHQMPNEVTFLRCFDSLQGVDGEALFTPHGSLKVVNDKPYDGEYLPRTSIEVRLVVFHEKL